MGHLEAQILDALEQLGKSLYSDRQGIVRGLLVRKIRRAGHRVTASAKEQIALIAEAIDHGHDAAQLQTKLDALKQSRGGKSRSGPVLDLQFDEADWQWVHEVVNQALIEASAQMLRDSIEASWRALQQESKVFIESDQYAHQRVCRVIERAWGRAFRWCLLLANLCTQIAEMAAADTPSRGVKPKVRQSTKVALQHLQARGCLAFREVLHLLRGGYPDAAIARWRLLHELDVFAVLIAEGTPQLASRFMDHERMELHSILAADGENFESEDDKAIEKRRQRALARYGADFGNPLGWAIELVGKRRPQFRELQIRAEKSQHRQTYLLACAAVHASSVGVRRPLGGDPALMLVGPSSSGIYFPATSAVKSLVVLSSTLLDVGNSVDSVAMLAILSRAGTKALRELELCEQRRQLREEA